MHFEAQQGMAQTLRKNMFPIFCRNGRPPTIKIDSRTALDLVDLVFINPVGGVATTWESNGFPADSTKTSILANMRFHIKDVFGLLFDLHSKPFLNTFGDAVNTNGITASVKHVKKLTYQQSKIHSGKKRDKATVAPYVQDVSNIDLSNKLAVGIDPNIKDVIYAHAGKVIRDPVGEPGSYTSPEESHCSFFETSNNQRYLRKFKGMNRERKKEERDSRLPVSAVLRANDTAPDPIIGNRNTININRLEWWYRKKVDNGALVPNTTTVTKVNNGANTVIFHEWEKVVKYKSICIQVDRKFKERKSIRLRAFRKYILKARAEATMIRRFKEKVGGPDAVVIFFGDTSAQFMQGLKHHAASIKAIGIIRLLILFGYIVFMVNEAFTTQRCHQCRNVNAVTKIYKTVKNQRPKTKKQFPYKKCWGLLSCSMCTRVYNRDVNASRNIFHIAATRVCGGVRPQYLCPAVVPAAQ